MPAILCLNDHSSHPGEAEPTRLRVVDVVVVEASEVRRDKTNTNSAVVVASAVRVPLSLLRRLSIFDESVIWIRKHDYSSCVPVSVRLSTQHKDCEDTDHSIAENVVCIHPITALNLNLSPVQHDNDVKDDDGENDEKYWMEPHLSTIRRATQVTLRPWGLPASVPRLLDDASSERQTQAAAITPLLPPPNTLLVPGHLIAVVSTNKQTQHSYFYYEVARAVSDDESTLFPEPRLNEPASWSSRRQRQNLHPQEAFNVFRSDARTAYRLETRVQPWTCPQLPPVRSRNDIPHPNLSSLIKALSLPATSTPEQRILAVVGTDPQHHVHTAVTAAAACVGRTCLSIAGLAAHKHKCSGLTRSASFVDKLAGLELALRQAYQAAPCVLLIQDLDLELDTGQDLRLRNDQMQRFWSLLTMTATSANITGQDWTIVSHVPSVLIVLSMSTPLLFLEYLIWEPIILSLPDATYTKYLWHQQQQQQQQQNGIDEEELVWSLLQGRNARDIKHLAQQVAHDKTNNDANFPLVTLLQRRLEKWDALVGPSSSASSSIPQVKWSDVGGLDQVRQEILETIELPLKYPHLFGKKGGRCGILLYGPPGTGKTLVAKAVANECGLPFLSVKGPELLGSFVGESEANVRAVFAQARALATTKGSAVLFFDELDSLAPRRSDGGSGGASVMDRVVATLFTELDRSSSSCVTIFCIGATNRPDMLDPALLRPGRLDRAVYLGLSSDTTQHNQQILQVHLSKLKLPPHTNASDMAASVLEAASAKNQGVLLWTGADLASIASSAMLLATQRLCDKAEAQSAREGRSIDYVLAHWSPEQLEPIVEWEDLLQAAETVIPSVSATQLARYEQIRRQLMETNY